MAISTGPVWTVFFNQPYARPMQASISPLLTLHLSCSFLILQKLLHNQIPSCSFVSLHEWHDFFSTLNSTLPRSSVPCILFSFPHCYAHTIFWGASDHCQNPTLKSSERELSHFQALPEYFPLVTGRRDNQWSSHNGRMLSKIRNFSSFHPACWNHFTFMLVQSYFFHLAWSQISQIPLLFLGLAEVGHATNGIQHFMGPRLKSWRYHIWHRQVLIYLAL